MSVPYPLFENFLKDCKTLKFFWSKKSIFEPFIAYYFSILPLVRGKPLSVTAIWKGMGIYHVHYTHSNVEST